MHLLKALSIDSNSKLHANLAIAFARNGDREKSNYHQQQHQELREKDQNELKEGREEYDDLAALLIDMGELYSDMARVYLSTGAKTAAQIPFCGSSNEFGCHRTKTGFGLDGYKRQ